MNVIFGIVYFRKIFLASSQNASETTPWILSFSLNQIISQYKGCQSHRAGIFFKLFVEIFCGGYYVTIKLWSQNDMNIYAIYAILSLLQHKRYVYKWEPLFGWFLYTVYNIISYNIGVLDVWIIHNSGITFKDSHVSSCSPHITQLMLRWRVSHSLTNGHFTHFHSINSNWYLTQMCHTYPDIAFTLNWHNSRGNNLASPLSGIVGLTLFYHAWYSQYHHISCGIHVDTLHLEENVHMCLYFCSFRESAYSVW